MAKVRRCKKCKREMKMVIIENNSGILRFYTAERLKYCDDCWKKKQGL